MRDLSESTTPSSPADTPSRARQIGRLEPHANSAGETPVATIALSRVPLIHPDPDKNLARKKAFKYLEISVENKRTLLAWSKIKMS
jgi:hypothetical protein